jgi:hypothetical protein
MVIYDPATLTLFNTVLFICGFFTAIISFNSLTSWFIVMVKRGVQFEVGLNS